MQEKILELNVVRAGLMICIVLYHSFLFWSGNWFYISTEQTSPYLAVFAQWLNSFHIYGFVFLSGYLFYYLRKEKGKYQGFSQFIKQKALRLLLPYLAISVLWNIPFNLYFSRNVSSLIPNYLLGIKPGQLWFLLMLFLVFIIFYFLERQKFFYKQKKLSFMSFFCVTLCYALSIIGNKIIPNYFQIWTALQFIIFFYLGFITRAGVLTLFLKDDNCHLFFYGILQIILFILAHTLKLDLTIIINLCCHILGAFISFNVLLKLGKYISASNFVKTISEMSFGIYLFHQQIIFVCLYIMVNKFIPSVTSIVCFVISYMVSFAITFVLAKFRYTCWIIGMKQTK